MGCRVITRIGAATATAMIACSRGRPRDGLCQHPACGGRPGAFLCGYPRSAAETCNRRFCLRRGTRAASDTDCCWEHADLGNAST